MTPRDLMAGIVALEKKFRREYKLEELNRHWPALLACDRIALEKAVGRMMASSRSLPDVGYVLAKVQEWQGRKVLILPVSNRSGDEGNEVLLAFQLYQAGEMNKARYVAELYRLAEKWNGSGYARLAYELERLLAPEEVANGELF